MRIRLFYVAFVFLFSITNLKAESFNLKKIEDIKKLVGIIKTTEQMSNLNDKIEILSFVTRSINFRTACTCVKKAFFKVLSDLNNSIIDTDFNDLRTLDSFLQSLSRGEMVTKSYKKRINKVSAAIKWILGGRVGVAPEFIKELVIKMYQKKYDCAAFVEVGGCHVGMLVAQHTTFKKLYAVGFGDQLSKSTSDSLRKYPHIKPVMDNSVKMLSSVIKKLNSGAIFWADAKKLKSIMPLLKPIFKKHDKNVVLIENAGFLGPDGVSALSGFVKQCKAQAMVEVRDDIIRIKN